ncbi:MAG TPA: hypothetical protein VGQ33_04865, partial [Vicinamibacteria bacterium]|nr:hypothetical protein [Vicinamibacteria bacterium]
MPVTGMEAEFNVVLDGVEIDPRAYWKDPTAFIDVPLLRRTRSSLQLPTGGAVYFDRGVIEVVTPVIELAPGSTARMVRNLWEQIQFVRDQLTKWEKRTGHDVRLKAYSAHYNISYEMPPSEQSEHRNIQKLAHLLTYILPVPVAVVGTNRRSTGVGVRPREERIEVTADFTPDPGLMIANAALIVGIVREAITWPSYELEELDRRPIPVPAGVVPGKHTTRKGWLTKDFQYPQSPYTCDIDARIWKAQDGSHLSLRGMARQVAWYFRRGIRRYSDPFTVRHLFGILDGRAPSMLELPDRPPAYEDVGRLCRWGMVLPSLEALARGASPLASRPRGREKTYGAFVADRSRDRESYLAGDYPAPLEPPKGEAPPPKRAIAAAPSNGNGRGRVRAVSASLSSTGVRTITARQRRRADAPLPVSAAARSRRRVRAVERRSTERRGKQMPVPFPDRRLTRSAYEKVFL